MCIYNIHYLCNFKNMTMYSAPVYIAIDLKSFYASIECVERSLDPLDTHLVVADKTRTEKTICLAVSPSLKEYGISGRARLFQVINKVSEINTQRKFNANHERLCGKSFSAKELASNSEMAVDFIIARPQMALYIEYSKRIYNVYLKYFAPENIHVYSIDEVFIDITSYLNMYHQTPIQIITTIIKDIYHTTGITATGGDGHCCKTYNGECRWGENRRTKRDIIQKITMESQANNGFLEYRKRCRINTSEIWH